VTAPVRFRNARLDGRSDSEVVIEMVSDATPGTLFEFDAIIAALRRGCPDRDITVTTARQAVARAYTRLLRLHARALVSVTGSGYRLAAAASHQMLAHRRQRRSDTQLRRGLDVLRNVRWDEMDTNSRAAHEGTLLVMSALYENQRALDRRQGKIEAALKSIAG